MLKRKLSPILSLFLIVGFLVTGCGQAAQPAATTPSTPPVTTSSTPAEDPAKEIKGAIETYFNDIGSNVKNSYKIAEKDLKDELDKNPDKYAVLDLRRAEDYAKGHIKGAINVPYGPDIAKNLDSIRAIAKDKTLIVACYTGQTAGQTNSLLNVAGIKTLSLNSGMGGSSTVGFETRGWLGQKYPTVTEPTAMPTVPAVASKSKAIDEAVKKYFNEVPKDSYKIDLPVMKDALAKEADKYYIVDVRTAVDYAKGHIKGAVNIPYGPDVAKNLDSIKDKSKGKTVVVYCYTGQTAGQTDSLLNIFGIPTKSLNYGFGMAGFSKGWSSDKSYEVVQ
ncbi:rhodanese-like domain-containing protein [Desulfosporosinus nitroreducens]|uniref:Rhodanese-like domain-containing protein n=1 Tax=Desulfosporosinus nitroreducens TaxID=2018668 RepID=A0ABT8QQ28_9FIRM|nr:rhodanese-like domain-containing protein [Desulfosporosinus nitroreducens]MCO1601881.1 rhodanese-like domain-containing protein [Desulfosporosinus nitroreducens]MDO0823436.1 rhodanese-like domain-containing protein [Desulfosporosinus nitroreducens]